MVPEWVNDSSDAPSVGVIFDRADDGSSCCDGSIKHTIGVSHDHDHAHRATAQGLRAEIQVLRRFVRDPEFGRAHSQFCDYFSIIVVDPEKFGGAERILIELDRLRAPSHG